jgi:hypothetical protein
MQDFIAIQTAKVVREQDQVAFRQDVLEDLQEIDQSYIAGLGITSIELNVWLLITSKKAS